jgi:hypothetical protein
MQEKTVAKQQETNQRAVTEDDEEWMDGASASFPKAEHLAPSVPPNFGPGRLVAIWALENGSRKNDKGKVYSYVETVTLVLDEGPDERAWLTGTDGWAADASQIIGPSPVRLDEFQHSTGGLVARLSKRVDGTNAKGVKLKYRPMVGRLNTQASKANKNVAAFSIAEPTAEDMEIARRHKDLILSINRDLEARDMAAEDSAAFE